MTRPTKGVIFDSGEIVGRVCSKCRKPKDSSKFGPDKRNSTGLQSWCRKCIAARQAERVKQNPEERARRNEQSIESRKRNPDSTRARNKQTQETYRKRHPNRIKARGRTAYQLRDRLLGLFNRCMACGTDQDLTIDHVIALGQPGATNDPSNLQVLCRSCNTRKGDQTTDYRTDEQLDALGSLT